VAVAVGETVGASAMIYGDLTLAVTWYDANGVYVGGSQDAPDGGSGWRKVTHTALVPAGVASAKAIIRSRVAQWFGLDLLTVGALDVPSHLRSDLPAPTLPQDGDDLTVEWAEAVIASGARGWRYVPLNRTYCLNGVAGTTTPTAVECTTLPANDPRVKAVAVEILIRVPSTASVALTVRDWDGTSAGQVYTTGVADRYGIEGAWPVMVGGPNNRSIKWSVSTAGALGWIAVDGYWIAED
jgi:hypothetical protein